MEEERDWCVAENIYSNTILHAMKKSRAIKTKPLIAENLSKGEAVALLATIGKVEKRLWREDEFYARVKE